MRARRHIGVLIRHDLRYTLSSPRGLLFLVFFALFWSWMLVKLATGWAAQLGTPQAGFLVSWMFDATIARLVQERPAALAAYFVVATTLTPLFAMLASCDQTATDLGTRHIRFLIPRVGRAEIFVARLLGAAIVVSVAQLLAGIAATIVAIVVHGGDGNTGAIVAYGASDRLPDRLFASHGGADVAGVRGDGVGRPGAAGRPGRLRDPGADADLDAVHRDDGDDRQLPGAERAQAVPAAPRDRTRAGRERGRVGLCGAVRVPGLAGLSDAGRLMSATPIIKTEGLGRDFGRTRALAKIDLTLEAGAPIGLVGPNGAGKTTFFSVLCGFLRPTRGTVEVLGRPPLHRDVHGRVAILPQDAAFVRGVPVLSQLAMLAELQGFSAKAARAEAARVLQLVLLADAAKKSPEMLSHGMLKRIAIAQAFLGAPEVVLLDEPTAGLDPATASEMKNLIRSLDKERTFVISSHNLQDIEELCGSVVILDRGKIVEHRKVSELVGRTSCLTFRLESDPARDDRRRADSGGAGDARRAGAAG